MGGTNNKMKTETCNGLDDDCDDLTDEGCACSPPGSWEYCGPDKGECKQGTKECGSDGTWGDVCIGQKAPTREVCNGKDDDFGVPHRKAFHLICQNKRVTAHSAAANRSHSVAAAGGRLTMAPSLTVLRRFSIGSRRLPQVPSERQRNRSCKVACGGDFPSG